MRALRLVLFLPSLMLAAASAAGSAITSALDRVFDVFATLFASEPLRLFDEPRLALSTAGSDQVDGTTYFRNRHEAGLARLGAVRHT